MPGLAVGIAEGDIGYVSSSTSTLASEDSNLDKLNKLASMAISVTSSKDLSPSRVSSTETSTNMVNLPSPSYHISSPTPLSHFPSDDDISPFSTPPVLLRVGGPDSPPREIESVLFFVHEKLLTRASTFFRSGLSFHRSNSPIDNSFGAPTYLYSFLEAQSRTINLPEDRPGDVRFFLRWLYHGFSLGIFRPEVSSNATSSTEASPQSPSNTPATSSCPTTKLNTLFSRHVLHGPQTSHTLHLHAIYNRERALLLHAQRHGDETPLLPLRPKPPSFGPLIRLYVFADKYQVGLGVKDLICDLVREVASECNAVPGVEDVELLWGNIPTKGGVLGGLKKLVLDLYMGMKTERLLADEEDWDVGFLRDLVAGLRGGYGGVKRKEMRTNGGGGGGDVNGGIGQEGLVKVGSLVRSGCAYHDHCW